MQFNIDPYYVVEFQDKDFIKHNKGYKDIWYVLRYGNNYTVKNFIGEIKFKSFDLAHKFALSLKEENLSFRIKECYEMNKEEQIIRTIK